MGQVWGIVVAAGSGRRFGGPKQFESLHGRRILDWSVATARAACDDVVAVLPPDALQAEGTQASSVAVASGLGPDQMPAGRLVVVAGGATRSASVRAGLAAVGTEAEIVVVHDAARPVASAQLFATVIEAVRAGADAAIPAISMADTIKQVAGAAVMGTVERASLVAVQTPQAFRAAWLRRAHESGHEASDDAALVEALGGSVVVVPGEGRNLKITSPDDLLVAGLWLAPTADAR